MLREAVSAPGCPCEGAVPRVAGALLVLSPPASCSLASCSCGIRLGARLFGRQPVRVERVKASLGLTRGPRAGHLPRRGVPLRVHSPWVGGPLGGLGAPIPSRAFDRTSGRVRSEPMVVGLESLRVQLGHGDLLLVHSERKFQSHPTVPPGRLLGHSESQSRAPLPGPSDFPLTATRT